MQANTASNLPVKATDRILYLDILRNFHTRLCDTGATWKFGNQKVKGVRKGKGGMADELRRLQGAD